MININRCLEGVKPTKEPEWKKAKDQVPGSTVSSDPHRRKAQNYWPQAWLRALVGSLRRGARAVRPSEVLSFMDREAPVSWQQTQHRERKRCWTEIRELSIGLNTEHWNACPLLLHSKNSCYLTCTMKTSRVQALSMYSNSNWWFRNMVVNNTTAKNI